MNKSMLVGVIGGIAVATAGVSVAGYWLSDKRGDSEPRVVAQDCYEVESSVEPRDEKRIAGSVVGGLIGGAVGNDVGDSDITTVAGAAVGAIAGNQAQRAFQENRTTTALETRCDPAR